MRPSGLIGILALIAAICSWETQAMATDGLITIKSSFGPADTMKRLETEVQKMTDETIAEVDAAMSAKEKEILQK